MPCDTPFTLVSCCGRHTVAIDVEGNLWACGNNEYGQLGLQDNIDRNVFAKVRLNDDTGDNHTITLDIKGNLWSCGDNEYGQMALK